MNILTHGIDFCDALQVFDKPMLKKMDNRRNYGEGRWIALAELYEVVVVMVYTLRGHKIRVISMRRANRYERKIYQERFKKPD